MYVTWQGNDSANYPWKTESFPILILKNQAVAALIRELDRNQLCDAALPNQLKIDAKNIDAYYCKVFFYDDFFFTQMMAKIMKFENIWLKSNNY